MKKIAKKKDIDFLIALIVFGVYYSPKIPQFSCPQKSEWV
jgi:hypothetical protein